MTRQGPGILSPWSPEHSDRVQWPSEGKLGTQGPPLANILVNYCLVLCLMESRWPQLERTLQLLLTPSPAQEDTLPEAGGVKYAWVPGSKTGFPLKSQSASRGAKLPTYSVISARNQSCLRIYLEQHHALFSLGLSLLSLRCISDTQQ